MRRVAFIALVVAILAGIVVTARQLSGLTIERPEHGFAMRASHPWRLVSDPDPQPEIPVCIERSGPDISLWVKVESGTPRAAEAAATEAWSRRTGQERRLDLLERSPVSFDGQSGVLLRFHDRTPPLVWLPSPCRGHYFCWVTTRGARLYEFVAPGEDRDAVDREAHRVFSTIRFTDARASPAPDPPPARPPRD